MSVIWTNEALQETIEIYNYYKFRGLTKIAEKIKSKILSSTKNLNKQAKKGQIEELLKNRKGEYRYILEGNYKIIYKVIEKNVYVIKIFDCRRNPNLINNK